MGAQMVKLVTPEVDFNQEAKAFNLLGTDGQKYQLYDCQGKNGIVVAFICNHCPYVKAIVSRMVVDASDLMAEGIGFVAINSNDAKTYPEDSYEKMQEFAATHSFRFPYLLDDTQAVAKAYGAICTPDFFGYSKHLKLQYRGRLDNHGMKPKDQSLNRELVEAMRLVAQTDSGPKVQHPSQGCSIKWL